MPKECSVRCTVESGWLSQSSLGPDSPSISDLAALSRGRTPDGELQELIRVLAFTRT
jgi:hypothetical protein